MGDSFAHVQATDVLDRLFAERPDYGVHNIQKRVQLVANYFEMVTKNPKLILYVYGMSFKAFPPKDTPPSEKEIKVPEGKKLVQVIRCALNTSTFTDIKSKIATDFNKKLISCEKLDSGQMQTGEFKFWAENEIEDGASKPRKNAIRFQMTLEQQRKLYISDLLGNLGAGAQGGGAHADALEIVQVLDTILGHSVKLSLEVATPKQGKSFPLHPKSDEEFMLRSPIGTLGYLHGVRGFFASVRATSNRILVNCNACCGAFYKPGPLVNLFAMFITAEDPSLDQYKRLESAIQGLRVELTHLRDDPRQPMPPIRTIYGLARPPGGPNAIRFYHKDDDKTYTVAEYWRKKGYERILNNAYPVVNVGDRDRPTFVPPHVLNIVPGQMARKRLDSTQTLDMIDSARRQPEQICQSINNKAFGVLGLKKNATLESFGVSLKTEMVSVQGRVLDEPTIIYKTRSNPPRINDKARWNLSKQQVFESRELRSWGIMRIVRDARRLQSESAKFNATFNNFLDILTSTLGQNYVDRPDKSWSVTVVRGDETTLKRAFVESQKNGVRLLVIVLSDDDASTYRQIKTLGDIEYGISTVCVRGEDKKFYMFKAAQYFANIALKINLKLGGINHALQNQRPLYDTTMVIGIDVTHPSPGPTKRTAPSVAAMVASIDSQLAQWLVDLRINTAGKEMVDLLGPMLGTRLELWKRKHQGLLPHNLLVYRDGVSESQYEAVLREELEALRNTCNVMYADREQPRMTLIIVGKRHHTRFFRQSTAGASNPVYGTVVDTGVTEAHNWDFFLQSHHALVGTARPAHYFVLLNEIFTREFVGQNVRISDYVQKLTYEMCYLFGRSTGPVSIPPPVYYADLACERSRCYGDFDDNMSDTSSMGGSGRDNSHGGQGAAQVPYRSGPSGGQASNRPGPSNIQNKQGPRKEDASKKPPQPTQSRMPDVMAGKTKKERARIFEENARQRAGQGSSKAEGKEAEAKPEAKAGKDGEEKLPEKGAGQKPGEGKAKEDTQSKAQGKKPETRAEAQGAETQAEVKQPRGKGQVEIHPNLANTMFYI